MKTSLRRQQFSRRGGESNGLGKFDQSAAAQLLFNGSLRDFVGFCLLLKIPSKPSGRYERPDGNPSNSSLTFLKLFHIYLPHPKFLITIHSRMNLADSAYALGMMN